MEPPIHNTNKNKMTIFMMVCKQANIIPNASILTSIYEIVHYCMKELFPWIVHFIRFTVVLLHRAKQNMSWNWFNYTIPSIYHDSVQLSTKYNTYNHDTFSSRPAMLTHWWEKFPPWQGCKLALYRSMKVNILKAWVLGSVIPTSFLKNPTFIFHSYFITTPIVLGDYMFLFNQWLKEEGAMHAKSKIYTQSELHHQHGVCSSPLIITWYGHHSTEFRWQ